MLLKQSRLFFQFISLPQSQPVKLFHGHTEHLDKLLWGQVALEKHIIAEIKSQILVMVLGFLWPLMSHFINLLPVWLCLHLWAACCALWWWRWATHRGKSAGKRKGHTHTFQIPRYKRSGISLLKKKKKPYFVFCWEKRERENEVSAIEKKAC